MREPDVVITAYDDGPLVVRGDVVITDMQGEAIDPGRSTIALCRCGRSSRKPFCDGSHKRGRAAARLPRGEPAS